MGDVIDMKGAPVAQPASERAVRKKNVDDTLRLLPGLVAAQEHDGFVAVIFDSVSGDVRVVGAGGLSKHELAGALADAANLILAHGRK